MKILVVSDIHANKEALRSIVNTEKIWDILVCAGDYVDYGTSPAEVVDYFSFYDGLKYIVKGNHDSHLATVFRDGSYKVLSGQSYKWIHYNCSLLNSSQVEFLENLPDVAYFVCDGISYLVKHQYDDEYGQIETESQFNDFWNLYVPESVPEYCERRIIFGHTHRQYVHRLSENICCMNPGSISYRRPDDPEKRAEYMVIKDGRIRFCKIPYDRSVQLNVARDFNRRHAMKETELQDFYFFFGSAPSARCKLEEI